VDIKKWGSDEDNELLHHATLLKTNIPILIGSAERFNRYDVLKSQFLRSSEATLAPKIILEKIYNPPPLETVSQ